MDVGRLSVSPVRRHAISLALVAAGIAGFLLWRASPAAAATFTVNSTNNVDDGTCDGVHCSLQEAINAANATADADNIAFNIPGAGVQTIAPTSSLPTITEPVTIDGYTQPGASANTLATGNDAVLLIELNGSGAGAFVNGLSITGGGSTVRGLVINRFGGRGIEITDTGNNVIAGNFIGTNAAGTVDLGNSLDGVFIDFSPTNTMGGTAVGARNVISGNDSNGVRIVNSPAPPNTFENTVLGNYIGTNAAGTADLGNSLDGVRINEPNNTVGGTAVGAGNVISGNDSHGVEIINSPATGNSVLGNYIGTNAAGTASLGNSGAGVFVNGASANTIGGTTPAARNVISGNNLNTSIGFAGVDITGTGNFVQGNYLGTNAAGTAAIPNVRDGVIVRANGNTIGGDAAGAGNLVSGNTEHGVNIFGASNTVVQGNLVGTDAAGTADLGNGRDGVRVLIGSNNTIGGTTAGASNVISGNGWAGVHLFGASTTLSTVQGNFIGTNAAGTAALGNTERGVFIDGSPNSTIGGTAAGSRNIISGNNTHGVEVNGAAATGNTILGNYIGTNAAGTASLGNSGAGVFVGASSNTVGGTTSAARNVISGNNLNTLIGFAGIDITGTNNVVQGNYLGTNAAGTAAIPNARDGVIVRNNGNTVGGSTAGAGNLISGNTEYGVNIFGASNNTVQGNLVGTNAAGTGALSNGRDGVRVLIGSNNTIGGTTAGAANVISSNGWAGVHLFGGSTSLTTVEGNLIGTDAAGTAYLGNGERGVFIDGSPNNTIGGTAAGSRNVISGNNTHGVQLSGLGATGNTVQGNYIGTDVTGAVDLGNASDGVHILEGTNNTIGGTAAGARNVISGNTGDGVRTAGVNGATVQGNYIGIIAAGTAGLGNGGEGVHISGSANIMVGGAAAGAGNVISANGSPGVQVEGCCGTNTIQGNFIGTNAAGTDALGNPNGVVIFSSSVQVGGTAAGAGNVISGNNDNGLVVAGSLTTVQGNYIGTDLTGAVDLGNASRGLIVTTGGNTIGGTVAGARNIISGNNGYGVEINGASASGNTIQGNYIGTNSAGTDDLGNTFDGVFINGSPNNAVGGTAAGARNVISGNDNQGILISGAGATGNTVQGNYIGTNVTGTADLGNRNDGVVIDIASNTTIGGSAAGAGNVVSGNNTNGMRIVSSTGTTVQGNYIGTDATGTDDLGNSAHGISISGGSPSNTIGGTAAGAGNTIAFNGDSGVILSGGSGNAIRGNSINLNADLGIDLVPAGVTANDTDDGDGGPNELQNFPEITGVFGAGASTTVEGTLNSTANTDFDLDFYENDECDPARHGEGQTYLGSFAVSTDSNGDASFSETIPGSVAAGQFVTGTATDPNGNTSEFSLCNPPPTIVVINTNDSGVGSLRAAIASVNASPGPDTIEFDIPGADLTIDLASALPTITDPVVIDGATQPGYSGTPIVELNGAGAGATADGLKITAGDSTVKGLVINGFGGDGIELLGGGGNTVRGNYLGTDATGGVDLGNGQNGLRVNGSSGNLIGGAASGAGNLISGNNSRGVALLGSGATGNLVRGNLVGTDAGGTADLGNAVHGVAISTSASNNTIGGQGPNTMAFNGDDGVWVGSGTGNRVLRNSIHSNDGLGIDVGADGVTPNDAGDEDTGANMLQNFPVLDAALVGGGATAVFGTLESEADTDYRLHFWHSTSCDPSGNGEGQTYLGNKLVSTDADGLASFRATFAQIAQNRQVTAVAVDPVGNTSEFSGCEPTTLRPTLAIDDVTVTEGNSGTTPAIFTVTRSGNTGGTSTVNFTTANVTAVAPGDYTTTSGTLSFASGETTKTITVNVAGDVLDEANETFRVNLSAPVDATISDSQGVGTITDDDPTPTLSINDVTVVEGDSGTARAIFTVSLSGASGQKVTVNYATANGTATAPGDYSSRSGTLSFSPGVTTQSITVRVNGDNAVEADETYFVNLSGATNATISDGQGQGTIQNDD